MSKDAEDRYVNRELSWLSFNGRVLQEAADPSVPLFERLGFLAIFSSNLDEFFRVRVASLRSLLRLKKKAVERLGMNPRKLLQEIHDTVTAQQERFGEILRGQIIPGLEEHGIFLVDERRIDAAQGAILRTYFDEHVRPHLHPVVLGETGPGCEEKPFLHDRQLYLVVELWARDESGSISMSAEPPHYGLVEVPSPPVERFVWVPGEEDRRHVMFVDDVIRYNLDVLFPDYAVGAACAVKLSRDAELYLDDEYEGDLVEKIRKSLGKRETGLPSRFLYDLHAPYAMVAFMKQCFGLEDEDLVQGGRYHNLNDLHGFPRFGLRELSYAPLPPLPHPELEAEPSMLEAVAGRDRLLHFPYQRFDYVLRFLEEAADDPDVEAIWITLYRVARSSAVAQALIRAARQGKRVTAFVEVKARFDEETNLQWAGQMEAAGVRTLYSMPGLKVHAKLALVARREGEAERLYAYLGTGNFNEKTARVYADHALLTADPRLTEEVRRVFRFLEGEEETPAFEHLLVAPFFLRKAFNRLVAHEAKQARNGRPAAMTLKMNSLEDPKMIGRLYEALEAGVDVRLVVRGICCLAADAQLPNLAARSIVDRFLEHARIYVFHHDGEELLYLASADWMRRNLNRRVEVAFPIYDPLLRRELRAILDLQLADDTKARHLDAGQDNRYVLPRHGPRVRAQTDTYRMLLDRLEAARTLRRAAGGDADLAEHAEPAEAAADARDGREGSR